MKNLKTGIKFSGIACALFFLISIQAVNAKAQVQAAAKEQSKVFRAGAATSNITPSLGGLIIGGWGTPEATHIHDELHARCLVLDDGFTKLVFIVADLLGIDQDVAEATKRIIEQETGIPVANVIISAIHTHSATSAMGVGNKRRQWHYGEPFDEYQSFVIRRFADVVRSAVNNLEPARIGWGVGNVPEHVFVRRWKMKEPVLNPFGGYDKVKMNPGRGPNLLEPAAQPDPQVSFISVQATDGKSIALLGNYGLHYVGGVPGGHISADYFAVFADRIQELLKADRQNPPFVGIMSNGTSGDVNNINFGGKPEKNAPYEKMRRVADDVAREVFRVHNTIQFHDWVPLAAISEEFALTVRKPDKEMVKRAEALLKQPESVKPLHSLEKMYAERILYLVEWPDQINVVLQTFRIGDLGVAASPFETFSETGMEIKAKSPFKTTFVIGLANGYNGYLPTPEQHELGGYETWLSTNRVEKEATTKMVAAFLRQFASMKQGTGN
ncbi:MAG: neutral/alkaline non-lysosomal ceramidase N-terminal domain-containing protein [Kiritimatiellia bacterium]